MYPWITLGPVTIPTFFILTSSLALFSLYWIFRRAEKWEFKTQEILDLSFVLMVGGFVGARAFHILFENSAYYKENPLQIFLIWEGGFVFYGGLIGAVLCGVFYFLYFLKRSWSEAPKYFDFFTPVLSFSYAVGRWGCLLAGCCYGKSCELPWAIEGRHPTAIYSSFWEFGVLFILLGLEKKPRPRAGNVFLYWLALHSLGRFWIEFLRDDFRGPEYLFSVSGWLSLIFFLGASGLLVRQRAEK